MFGRTLSLWRCLRSVEPGSAPDKGGPDVQEERRVWVRHPADLQTTYQPADAVDGARLSARVRNISLGGISLVVDRPFASGAMLSIELPGPAEGSSSTVLACIVHVKPQGSGEWALGCTFARELSDDDLAAFGARRVKQPPPDQRTWQRFPTSVTASYQRVTDPHPEQAPAEVLNISPNGVGLLVKQPVGPGALLSVGMHGANPSAERTMLACVVHVTARAEGEWALGCNFIRSLSEADLQALL
jgi:hypothetical protein